MNQPAATTSAKRPKPGARRAGAAGGHSQPMRDLERLGLALGIVFLLLRSAQGWFGNSLWLDEGYSREAIDHLRLSFSHYPGNMVLYKVFLVAWGSISIVPWWLRVPSMLASIATLCLVRGIARRVAGPLVAAIAPMTVAVVPMFWAKAIEARSYAPETLAVTGVWYCWLRARDTGIEPRIAKRWMWFLAAIATIGPLLHALFFTQFVAVVAAAAIARDRKRALRYLVPAAFGCAATTTWLRHLAANNPPGWFDPNSVPVELIQGYLSGWWWAAVVLGLFATIGVTALLEQHRSSHDAAALAPVLWMVIPLLATIYIRAREVVWDPRYLAPSAVAVGLLLAVGLELSIQRATTRFRVAPNQTAAIGTLFATLLVIGVVAGPAPPSERFENWNGATRLIAARSARGDGLLFNSPPVFAHFRAPFEASWSLLDAPPSIPVVSSIHPLGSVKIYDEKLTPAQIVKRAQRCERIWVVSYRGTWAYRAIVPSREFRRSFRLIETKNYDGDVRVQLYRNVDPPASPSC